MALFKVFRGDETNLPASMNDGWAYFCTDTGNFYIDWDNGENLVRTQINSNYANKLRYMDGEELVEINPQDIAAKSDIPQIDATLTIEGAAADAKAVGDAIASIPNADWNQNDENASDFIKNKPFYDINVSSIICDDKVDFERTFGGMDGLQRTLLEGIPDEGVPCKKGHIYNAIFNNENNEFVCQEVVCEQDGYLTMPVQDYDYYVEIAYGYKISIYTNSEYFDFDIFGEGVYNFTITEIETAFKTLDEKFIPDTIARVEDIPSTAIKPFPYYEVNELNAYFTEYKVNLEELETGVLYSVQESPTPYVAFALCIICDDGTEKIVTNIMDKTNAYYVNKSSKNITVYEAFGNSSDSINISDKSTSDNITVTSNLISRWLPLHNSIEYTPTGDYHPATKKYVDDTATTAANAIKNDLLNGAGEAYDTLKELGELIDDNVDAIEALEIIATGKADISDIPTKVSELTNDSGFITEAPQADWNQNDETATNYIKNKPILATSEEIKALFN